ncbi:hypothetical protein LY56_02212, partial [Roseinatronobacter thiooxidans]
MITTGIYLPKNALMRLESIVAEIHHATAPMTLAELRQKKPEGLSAKLSYRFQVEFTKSGKVSNFRAVAIDCSVEKFRDTGFEADIWALGQVKHGITSLAGELGEYLIWRVVEARRRTGERELVSLSDEQLEDVADEMEDLKSRLSYCPNNCGTSILGRVVSRDNFTKASPPAELLAARVSSISGSGRAGSFQENHGKGRSARRHPAIVAMNAPGKVAVTPLYAAELYCLAVSSAHQRHRNLPHRNMLPSVVSTVA